MIWILCFIWSCQEQLWSSENVIICSNQFQSQYITFQMEGRLYINWFNAGYAMLNTLWQVVSREVQLLLNISLNQWWFFIMIVCLGKVGNHDWLIYIPFSHQASFCHRTVSSMSKYHTNLQNMPVVYCSPYACQRFISICPDISQKVWQHLLTVWFPLFELMCTMRCALFIRMTFCIFCMKYTIMVFANFTAKTDASSTFY